MRGWTHMIDPEGIYVRVPLGDGGPPEVQCASKIAEGWRFAMPEEIEDEEVLRQRRLAHGVTAHREAHPPAVYALAAEIAGRLPFALAVADLDALNASVIGRRERQAKPGGIRPLRVPGLEWKRDEPIDVDSELAATVAHVNAEFVAGRIVRAAAYAAWRLTWLHPYPEGNGRTSRAASYALLLAGDPSLRVAHTRRLGGKGRDLLTVPERVEQSRVTYLAAVNGAHALASDGDRYRRVVDLRPLEAYIARLVEDQVAGRASLTERWPA